jgi:VanZ family protein
LTPRQLWLWGPVIAYMAAIFSVSSVSDTPSLPGGPSDKLLHVIVYAGLAVLAVRALAGGLNKRVSVRTAWLALAVTVGYGVTDELHQYFVPLRTMDALDIAADAVGGAAAVFAMYVRDIIRSRHGL